MEPTSWAKVEGLFHSSHIHPFGMVVDKVSVKTPEESSWITMTHNFKVGDNVNWNSEAGRVGGKVIRVHTSNFDVNGYTHHASAKAPQYEIKSNKTEHIAFHKASALTKGHD